MDIQYVNQRNVLGYKELQKQVKIKKEIQTYPIKLYDLKF